MAARKVRITSQLIDAGTGVHLWADRFDGSLENIFELQDQVASGVVGAIDPKLLAAEMIRVKRKTPADLNTYDCFLRASELIYRDGPTRAMNRLSNFCTRRSSSILNTRRPTGFAAYCQIWRPAEGWNAGMSGTGA